VQLIGLIIVFYILQALKAKRGGEGEALSPRVRIDDRAKVGTQNVAFAVLRIDCPSALRMVKSPRSETVSVM
jgi:hypothetical protein